MEAMRFQVSGRVQGVGFRAWTYSRARELGVTGSVRNRPDGSVEVEAEGSAEALANFRVALEKGPPGSRVAKVSESPAAVRGRSEFSIQR
jgi:acylphosphatase